MLVAGMTRTQTLAISVCCLIVIGGLSACGKTETNSNTVANTNGTAATTKPSPGLVLDISPAKGPAAGGTTVKITGEGFSGNPTIKFDTKEATEVKVVSATEISAVSPAGKKGETVDIVLIAPDAPTSTLVDGFKYE